MINGVFSIWWMIIDPTSTEIAKETKKGGAISKIYKI
jgi:hypothetical protein